MSNTNGTHPRVTHEVGRPSLNSETYRRTRRAWTRIWGEESDLASELHTLDYDRARRATSLYRPYLAAHGMLLEAGCGLGKELIQLRHQGYRAVGIDYAENALASIHAFDATHLLAAGDIHRLPFADESFAAYLSFGVLEHFDFGPGPALREAHRVLQPGGVLVVTVPYPNFVWRLARLTKLWGRPNRGEPSPYFETAYTVGILERLVRRAGFEVIDRKPIGHSFTLWGLGGPFRGQGYYETSGWAEKAGNFFMRAMPWAMCFESLLIGRKAGVSG